VRVWHEVKEQAVEVGRMAHELAGQVREWLDRAAERVVDRLGVGQSELALVGGVMAEKKSRTLPRRCGTHGKRGRAKKTCGRPMGRN
jgi:hypothetical protein